MYEERRRKGGRDRGVGEEREGGGGGEIQIDISAMLYLHNNHCPYMYASGVGRVYF